MFLYFLNTNVRLKQKTNPSDLLCHVLHTSVKSPIIHDPCVRHISHQQSHCGGTHLSDCLPLLSVRISFIFSKALPYSALCFKAATLITLAPWCELCMTAFAQACHWGIWGEMICINDGWRRRGDDEREENDMRQKERRSCQEKCGWWAPDHGSNEARPTFYLAAYHQLFICPSGWVLHTWATSSKLLCRVFAHMLGVNLKYQVENNWGFFESRIKYACCLTLNLLAYSVSVLEQLSPIHPMAFHHTRTLTCFSCGHLRLRGTSSIAADANPEGVNRREVSSLVL